jgi:predicted dehydrogenase
MTIRLGVIGYGRRIRSVINHMDKFKTGTRLTAITDIRADEIKEEMVEKGMDTSGVGFYADPEQMFEEEELHGVLIGTRCSLHAEMAEKVLRRNLPLFLEKPIATNMDDLRFLKEAYNKSKSQVVVSFPLRVTPLVKIAKEIIDSGTIGTIEHVQAVNNVPYGSIYFKGWYRDESETGGLFLQKATHDFDYINYLLGIKPIRIAAMKSKQIFKGDKPANLRCEDCQEQEECLESPFNAYYTSGETKEIIVDSNRPWCCFAEDTGNEDSSSALIQYETGMHVAYSQNFFARKAAGMRGARLLGYKGTIEFDWRKSELKVMMHHSPRVDVHKFDTSSMSHGGGDTVLARNFIQVIKGEADSVAPLEAGILSVAMCLAAKESAETGTFQDISKV